jgi:hypothetical protein
MQKTRLTHTQPGSPFERDGTPQSGGQSTIDQVLSPPSDPPEALPRDRIAQLSGIETPKTLPRPAHAEMNPKSAHQTTRGPPDTGFRLGFTDISTKARRSIASVQNSPTKSQPCPSLPQNLASPGFEFKFATESTLSDAAKKLMVNVRDEAARIKAQMLAEREEQDGNDADTEQLFGGVNTRRRKIAKPTGKAGRFSDIHMAEFKKMDSIANHASSFRAQPEFAQPTSQSLKRSGSRAGLDEFERPPTAGKGTPGKPAPPFMQPADASPFKSTTAVEPAAYRLENMNSAKRMRQSAFGDVSMGRPTSFEASKSRFRPSALPRAKPALSTGVFSPPKASLARPTSDVVPTPPPGKKPALPRSGSVRSLKSAFEAVRSESAQAFAATTPAAVSTIPASKLPRSESRRPLPPLPTSRAAHFQPNDTLTRSSSVKDPRTVLPTTGGLASRLPTFASLKSILRPSRALSSKSAPTLTLEQAVTTPKRTNTTLTGSESAKKVDFTPSTKSRYAVKLAAAIPSARTLPRAEAGSTPTTQLDRYDPSAYTIDDDGSGGNEAWEEVENEIIYPTLPPSLPATSIFSAPAIKTFSEKATQHNRRESKEFKSIFTTLEHPSRSKAPMTLTDVNTKVNQTNPAAHANVIIHSPSNNNLAPPYPSTIRRVRSSGVAELVQPFEDTIKTVPHGLPGKKRRRESDKTDAFSDTDEDAKENKKFNVMPQAPREWDESDDGCAADEEDEGLKRAEKRARIARWEPEEVLRVETKKPKPNVAREAAAKHAKDRKGKGKGILSLSRLNMLARPKERK